MKFGGCDMPKITAIPIFQQICLGMQEAHTVFYMSRDRRYVTWVQHHGSHGHMVEPKIIKGQSSSKC